MAIPIDRRPYDVFLSHAHSDAEFAATINRWLSAAGFRVWFDARAMAPSDQINRALEDGIRSSRALIVLASGAAVDKGWVQHELGVAHDERNKDRSFRLISVCIGDAGFEDVGAGFSQIRAAAPVVDRALALALLRAFHPPRPPIDPERQRDIYVSLGWQPGEDVLNTAVMAAAGPRVSG
jgi:hypothetical protein